MRGHHAEDAADELGSTRLLSDRGRDQEQRRFDAFTDDRHEGDHGESGGAPGRQCRVDLGLKPPAQGSSLAAHPEDHPGQQAGGDHGDDPLHDLFGSALEGTDGVPEHDADHGGDDYGRRGPQPHPPALTTPIQSIEVRQQDGDDEGRFDPFTQHDHERCHRTPRTDGGRSLFPLPR